MHLADTDASADRRLGQLVEEAEPDDPLVPIAQRVDELVDHDSRLETHRWSMTPLSAAELAGEIALVACGDGSHAIRHVLLTRARRRVKRSGRRLLTASRARAAISVLDASRHRLPQPERAYALEAVGERRGARAS